MAIRKAYVDWNKLDGTSVLVNKKTYMVLHVDEDTCTPVFATWYEQGTVVDVGLSDDMDMGEVTAEEKLLFCIFGKSRTFVIPEDGFYVMTADYGVDPTEYGGAFQHCKEQPICFGNRYGWEKKGGAVAAYWAEVPVLPGGLRLPSEDRPSMTLADCMDDKIAEVEARLANDRIAAQVVDTILGPSDSLRGTVDKFMAGVVYALPRAWAADLVLGAHELCVKLSKIPEQALRDLWDRVVKLEDGKKGRYEVERFCIDYGLDRNWTWLLFEEFRFLNGDFASFCDIRDKILSRGGIRSLNIPAVLQKALAMYKIPFRIGRCVKMEALGAPEVILVNELRMLAEFVIMAKAGSRIVCVRPDFEYWFGMKPDGSRGDGYCVYGDMELSQLPDPRQEPDEDDEDEDGSDGDTGEESGDGSDGDSGDEDEANGVIGVDYPYFAGVRVPNFMMRQGGLAIWDNANKAYVRDEAGNIERHDGCIRDRLDELNSAAAAGRD